MRTDPEVDSCGGIYSPVWETEFDDEGHLSSRFTIPSADSNYTDTFSFEGDVVISDSIDGSWECSVECGESYGAYVTGSGTWWAVWKSEEAP